MMELDIIYIQLHFSKIVTVIKTSSTKDEISRIFDNKAIELIKKNKSSRCGKHSSILFKSSYNIHMVT